MPWSYINAYLKRPAFIHKELSQRLSDSFRQDAFSTISNPESKLRTYGLPKRETFKSQIKYRNGHIQKYPRGASFCPFCINTIETEIHFLLKCPTYNIPRRELVDKITFVKPNFIFNSQTEKFQYLLSDINIKGSSKYFKKIIDIREFLINHPKMYC